MAAVIQQQLSFEVGGHHPTKASLGVTGKMVLDRQIAKGEEVVVTIADADGEIIAAGHGAVVSIAFTDKTDSEGFTTTTREHKVKLD